MTDKEKNTVLRFLHSSPLASVATISSTSPFPESAMVAFAEFDTFEIVFETFHTARKYENLLHNPHLSLVAGQTTGRHITLQYEGVAELIAEGDAERHIKHFLQKDTPCTEVFLRDPRAQLFKVVPIWLRYSDYTGRTPYIIEHRFQG